MHPQTDVNCSYPMSCVSIVCLLYSCDTDTFPDDDLSLEFPAKLFVPLQFTLPWLNLHQPPHGLCMQPHHLVNLLCVQSVHTLRVYNSHLYISLYFDLHVYLAASDHYYIISMHFIKLYKGNVPVFLTAVIPTTKKKSAWDIDNLFFFLHIFHMMEGLYRIRFLGGEMLLLSLSDLFTLKRSRMRWS